MGTVDLRLSNQRYKGFYIYKTSKGYEVGKNGTSTHTKFKTNTSKSEIKEFINKNL